jgi:hypothetical protein
MSLLREVAEHINATGSGSVDTLAPLFPDRTRGQIQSAIQNAAHLRLIEVKARGKSLGRGKGRAASTYGPYIEPKRAPRPANSVWQWATAPQP